MDAQQQHGRSIPSRVCQGTPCCCPSKKGCVTWRKQRNSAIPAAVPAVNPTEVTELEPGRIEGAIVELSSRIALESLAAPSLPASP